MADIPVILLLILVFSAGVLFGVGTLLLLEAFDTNFRTYKDRNEDDSSGW